jgi:hypothetical protein
MAMLESIDHRDHRCVSHRKHLAPVNRIARRLADRKGGAGVAAGIAAA